MGAKNGNGNGANKIVVIDSNTTDMHLYRRLFEKSAYQLIYFSKYEDAIDYIETENPVCVIIDYITTGESSTLKIIDILSTDHAVAVISDYHDPKAIKRAMEAGAHEYISKENLTLQSLERTIRIAVRGKNIRDSVMNIQQSINTLKTKVNTNFIKLNTEISDIKSSIVELHKKFDDQQSFFTDMNDAFLIQLKTHMDDNKQLMTQLSNKLPSEESGAP